MNFEKDKVDGALVSSMARYGYFKLKMRAEIG
jgi:hypothetical protein